MRKKQTTLTGAQTSSRPTIGVFIAYIDGYNCSVWAGIADVARERDVNVIAFGGRPLHASSGFEAQNNMVYSLANPELLDGLIILAGAIGAYIVPAEIHAFCRRYAFKPLVCIGQDFPDFPCILLDNKPGLRDLIEHLIVDHGYRRIAFIHGHDNVDAQQRYEAYAEVLMRHNIPLDPDLIAPGDLVVESGIKAIELLFEQRRLDIEAIVAVNDYTALGAIQALQERGLNVPDDIALTGFDNISEGWYSMPPLTTVEQPMYAIGRRAAEILLAQCQGADVPQQIMEPTRFIVRQSCGCLSQMVRQVQVGRTAPAEPRSNAQDQNLLSLSAQKAAILDEIEGSMRVEYGGVISPVFREQWERLLEDFLAELQDDVTERFASTLASVLHNLVLSGHSIRRWPDIISIMRRQILPFLTSAAMVTRAETLWQQAQILLGEMILQAQSHQHLQAERQAQILRDIGQTLITTFDVSQLMDVIAEKLPHLGITSCYLALYEHQVKAFPPPEPPEWTRLHLAYTDAGRIALESEERRFRSRELLPEDLLAFERQVCLLVIPLFFRENQLGFCLLEGNQRDHYIYDVLRGEISSALQGALLLKQIEEHSAELARQKYILDTFMETVPDSIYFKDRESRITRANQAHANALGYQSPTAEIGKTDFDFFPQKEAQFKYDEEQNIIHTGQPVLDREEKTVYADGRVQWYLVTKMPLRNEHGDIIGTFGLSRDITALKQAEAKIRKLERDTLEIQMAGGFAHEMRNALAGTKLVLEAVSHDGTTLCQTNSEKLGQLFHLLEPSIPPECCDEVLNILETIDQNEELMDRVLRTMKVCSTRALDVTSLILEYAKLGHTEGGTDSISIENVLNELVRDHQTTFAAQDILLRFNGTSETSILGHRAHFYGIFNNLILNARDALLEVTDDRERLIEVTLQQTGLHQMVTVRDTANGIPEEHINKIFSPFFSTKPTTGTGLGLNFVAKLVGLYHGKLEVKTEVGQGTTFTVVFPLQS